MDKVKCTAVSTAVKPVVIEASCLFLWDARAHQGSHLPTNSFAYAHIHALLFLVKMQVIAQHFLNIRVSQSLHVVYQSTALLFFDAVAFKHLPALCQVWERAGWVFSPRLPNQTSIRFRTVSVAVICLKTDISTKGNAALSSILFKPVRSTRWEGSSACLEMVTTSIIESPFYFLQLFVVSWFTSISASWQMWSPAKTIRQ